MAMYYFRQAERLACIEPERLSLAAEVILNLTKAIEIIFSTNRSQLRKKAAEWGFESAYIERWIIPLLLIRNTLDVAHVTSGPLTREQRNILSEFTSRAITHVHNLLLRIFDMAKSDLTLLDPISQVLDKDKEKLLAEIKSYAKDP